MLNCTFKIQESNPIVTEYQGKRSFESSGKSNLEFIFWFSL